MAESREYLEYLKERLTRRLHNNNCATFKQRMKQLDKLNQELDKLGKKK